MKKVLMVLGVLAMIGAGCSSSTDTITETTSDTTDSAATTTLSADVSQIKSNMEIMQVAANTDNCDGLLVQFAPDVATEEDCSAIAAFMIEKQAVAQVDWSAVNPDGSAAQLISNDGRVLANMVYDDSGLIWGYKLSDRFWE
ncbi:MAG: hypothetical protein ABH826_00120 [Patescibacteria group bacterium]|nr:hypothetical protein [Patescibacteria group bacterium]